MSTDVPDEIRRYRLADQAYEVIRGRILERRLLPGDRLSVPQLAEELGLSRTPVREAVQRIVNEGLGVERAHRGAVVIGFELEDLRSVYAVREVLEGLSARLAAGSDDVELVPDLRVLLDAHAAAIGSGREPDVIRADLRFHARVLAGAGNPSLSQALDPILGRVNIAMLAGDLRDWPRSAVREHQRILSAIAAGDADLADDLAREHVRLVRDRLWARLTSGASIPTR
jgi:DNA-binding GntR family transcriptional regulator